MNRATRQSGKPDSIDLENIWESGSGIDIRYEDLDEFLSKWPIIMQVKDGTATPSGAPSITYVITPPYSPSHMHQTTLEFLPPLRIRVSVHESRIY